jgi:hypothetical protein
MPNLQRILVLGAEQEPPSVIDHGNVDNENYNNNHDHQHKGKISTRDIGTHSSFDVCNKHVCNDHVGSTKSQQEEPIVGKEGVVVKSKSEHGDLW